MTCGSCMSEASPASPARASVVLRIERPKWYGGQSGTRRDARAQDPAAYDRDSTSEAATGQKQQRDVGVRRPGRPLRVHVSGPRAPAGPSRLRSAPSTPHTSGRGRHAVSILGDERKRSRSSCAADSGRAYRLRRLPSLVDELACVRPRLACCGDERRLEARFQGFPPHAWTVSTAWHPAAPQRRSAARAGQARPAGGSDAPTRVRQRRRRGTASRCVIRDALAKVVSRLTRLLRLNVLISTLPCLKGKMPDRGILRSSPPTTTVSKSGSAGGTIAVCMLRRSAWTAPKHALPL